MLLTIKQLLCRHKRKRSGGGIDWSETVCRDCGLRQGITGKFYGKDWNKLLDRIDARRENALGMLDEFELDQEFEGDY